MPADTILLALPTDGSDPLGLLAPSEFGTVPPTVTRCGCGRWGHAGCAHTLPQPRALGLALAGRPDDLGMARAEGVVRRLDLAIPTRWPEAADAVVNANPRLLNSITAAVSIAHHAPTYRLITTDPEGREVRHG